MLKVVSNANIVSLLLLQQNVSMSFNVWSRNKADLLIADKLAKKWLVWIDW